MYRRKRQEKGGRSPRNGLRMSTKCRQPEAKIRKCFLILQGYNVRGNSHPPSQSPHAYRNPAKRVCLQSEGGRSLRNGLPVFVFSPAFLRRSRRRICRRSPSGRSSGRSTLPPSGAWETRIRGKSCLCSPLCRTSGRSRGREPGRPSGAGASYRSRPPCRKYFSAAAPYPPGCWV